MLFIASLECGELGHHLSFSMQKLSDRDLLASGKSVTTHDRSNFEKGFFGFSSKTRGEQLSLGHAFLDLEYLEHEVGLYAYRWGSRRYRTPAH